MRFFRVPALALAALAITWFAAGCGSSSSTPTPANPTVTLSPSNTLIGAGQTAQFTATASPSSTTLVYSVDGIAGGNSTVGTISTSGVYTAPSSATGQLVTISVTDSANTSVTASAQVYVLGTPAVANTANGQVASYTIDLPAAGSMSVNFGTSTSYGQSTWTVSTKQAGPVTVLVAGMLMDTTYHMAATVSLGNGLTYTDSDHTFNSGESIPKASVPTFTITPGSGTPQPGIELMTNLYGGPQVYDLNGNLLWAYPDTDYTASNQLQPVKQLSNGDMLMVIGAFSTYPLTGPEPLPGTPIEIREVDLANNTIHSLKLSNLQEALNASGYKDGQGNQITLLDMHHDVTVNPDTGHWLLLTNVLRTYSDLTGITGSVNVLGDVVIDVDPNNNFAVGFVWNEFDHLDVNRHPWMFPDWTHSNAIVYSAADKNIVVSMRHQNWLVKVNYDDGNGDGSIVWHLGYQGDFTLLNGNAPEDWQYAQHGPSFPDPTNTSGSNFNLAVFDNGDDRILSDGNMCGTSGEAACYSRAVEYTLDETAMTANLTFAEQVPYNFFGGNAEILPNGDMESTGSGDVGGAITLETTTGSSPSLVLEMQADGTYIYRGLRIASMYPCVPYCSNDNVAKPVHQATKLKK